MPNRAIMIKNFILNHNMVPTMFNNIAHFEASWISETRFASVIIMLKRIILLKRALKRLVLSKEWSTNRESDQAKASLRRIAILDEMWWDQVDYILEFTTPMHSMLRFADTDKPSLHLIYDMLDDMTERVKRITRRSSPLYCLAHSLNPR